MTARRLPLLGLVASLAVASVAVAQPATRVLLVVDQGDDPFAERIRAELAALGLGVLTLEPWRTGETITSLEAVARREMVAAAVRMVPSRKGVEVWLADQATGRPLLRQLVVDESAEGPNEGLVALQTVELLRTTLRSSPPFGAASPRPKPPALPAAAASVTPVVAEPAPASPRAKVGVHVALGALFSPGGAGAAMQAWMTLQRSLGARLLLSLDASLPLRPATMGAVEGTARVGTSLAGIALLARADGPSAAVHVSAGVGVSVVRVAFDGQAIAPLVSRSTNTVTGAAYLRVDCGVDATDWLRLGVRGVSGLAAAEIEARFAGNQAGGWGRSFFAAFALAELSWR